MWVKMESIYTETDRFGNTKRFENRLEALGEVDEMNLFINNLIKQSKLPGLTGFSRKYLLSE